MNANQAVNRVFLLATAPFLGMMIWMLSVQTVKLMPPISSMERPVPAPVALTGETDSLGSQLDRAAEESAAIRSTVEKYFNLYNQSASDVSIMLSKASSQAARPSQILDKRIASVLGQPKKRITSENIGLALYSYSDPNYNAYALKVELKTDKAMKMALAGDKIGKSETTLAAVNRLGAVAGVNAGGFADDGGGKRYPTGNTIQDGKFVYGFFKDELSFVGLSQDRQLIGGNFSSQSELESLKPRFGASFTPMLLKDGKKQTIPVKWMTSPYRAARTVVGNLKNGQLVFIVANGTDDRGSAGASLAELQEKLQKLGVQDAYNLDGGGSSTLVWGQEIINRPSDGRMRAMPTHFVFFK